MDWILDNLGSLQIQVQAAFGSRPHKRAKVAASSSEASPEYVVPPGLRQVNDHVFEVKSPSGKNPSVEVVFFHGLQLEQSDKPHLDTWRSADGTQLWLNWITERFPDARILTVKYDGQPMRNNEGGQMDMYTTTENLLQCLTEAAPAGAEVGQHRCPVVLVGHCIGGLIMKQLCVYSNSKVAQRSDSRNKLVQKFLENVKGFFFYASPHHGTRLADINTQLTKGPLFEDVTTLNAEGARRNEDFRVLRQKFLWKTFGIAESREIALGGFTGLIVQEGSARHDVDGIYTAQANHFDVCRPDSRTSSTFSLLSNFVAGAVNEGVPRRNRKICFTDEDDVVGLHNKVIEVQQKLKRVRRLGIVGMGGIGKTTLARTLFNTISGNYDYVCYFHEVKRFVDEDENPETLRMKIIQNLFENDGKVDTARFQWSALKGKRVLIVLDDVVSEAQVRVMTEIDGFSDDSHLIVTSRKQTFLMREEFEFLHVERLSDEESEILFCISAFKKADAPCEYEERVATMIAKCGGFPLALKIVGRYLYGRPDKKTWADALMRLSNATPLNGMSKDGLWSTLKVSFDELDNVEREMFRDIATFLHGESLDAAKKIWSNCWKYDDIGWTNLLERGFVTEQQGFVYELEGYGAIIQMHEVLRDLGCSIACPKVENITTHHSRLNYRIAGTIPTWPSTSQGIPQTRVLKIEYDDQGRKHFQRVKFNETHMLRKFVELRFLWINGGSFYGPCHWLPEELVYLRIQNIRSWRDTLPEEFCRKELEPHQQLRYLEMSNDYSLETFRRSLKTLRRSLRTLPRSLGQLKALEYLKIFCCNNLESLHLKALKHLQIEHCTGLTTLPNTLGELKALEYLELVACVNLESLPDTLGKLDALEHLTIEHCDQLSLPNTAWQLHMVKRLVLRCKSIGNLGDYLGRFKALEFLSLDMRLEVNPSFFPGCLVELQHLEYLSILGMREGALPDIFGEFPALKELYFFDCKSLEGLPNSVGQLKALERLRIGRCESFKNLPTTIGQLGALRTLKITTCRSLNAFPESMWDLQTLEILCIPHFVSGSFGELRALKSLTLEDCDWKSLPSVIVQLHALESLTLVDCHNLEALPDNIAHLQALKSLAVRNCALKTLPQSIGALHALETLYLTDCDFLEVLPDSIGLLHALQYLTIWRARKLTALPHTLVQLRSLEYLVLQGCPSLKSLPDNLGRLESLQTLSIGHCDGLRELFDSIRQSLGHVRHVELC